MRWFRVEGLLDTLRPVYLAANILLVNFTTYNFTTRTVHRTLFDLIRFTITLLIDVFLTLRAVQTCQAFLNGTDSILINIGLYGSIVLSILLTSSIPLWNNLNGIAIFEMFQGIAICNDELKSLGVWIELWKRQIAFTLYVIFTSCNGFIVLIVNWFFPSVAEAVTVSGMFPDRWAVLAFARTNFITGISSCYSTLTLLALRKYFSLLNQTIAKYFPTCINPNLSKLEINPVDLIRKLATVHDRLSHSVKLFNYCFSSQLLFLTCSGFGYTLFSLFGVIHSFTTNASEADRRVALVNVGYDAALMINVVMFVIFSSLVNTEGNSTAVMIHKAIAYGSYESQTLQELRILSHQLRNRSSMISCGVIDFNWEFFYTFIGTLTSYLVILLQFDFGNLKLS